MLTKQIIFLKWKTKPKAKYQCEHDSSEFNLNLSVQIMKQHRPLKCQSLL